MEHNNHQIFNTVDEVLKFQRKCLDCHRLTPLQVLSRIIEENDGRQNADDNDESIMIDTTTKPSESISEPSLKRRRLF